MTAFFTTGYMFFNVYDTKNTICTSNWRGGTMSCYLCAHHPNRLLHEHLSICPTSLSMCTYNKAPINIDTVSTTKTPPYHLTEQAESVPTHNLPPLLSFKRPCTNKLLLNQIIRFSREATDLSINIRYDVTSEN